MIARLAGIVGIAQTCQEAFVSVRFDRRRFLTVGAFGAIGLMAACSTPAASPTAAPSKPAAATPAASKPAAPADSKPAATTAAKPAPTTPPKTQAPARKEVAVVRFATSPLIFGDAFRRMAIHKGFFKDVGLDVQDSLVDQGGTVMIRGIVAGQFEFASMGPDPALTTAQQGGGAKVVGAELPGLFYGIYSQRNYNSLADLKGKEIGTSAPGSLLEILLRGAVLESKMDPKDFPAVNVGGSPAVYRAVEAGKVEAGVTSFDFIKEAEASGKVKMLVSLSDILPKYICISLVGQEAFMKAKPDVAQDFVNAYARGIRYAMDHKDEAVALAAEKLAKKPEDVAWEFDLFMEKKIVGPDLVIPQDSLEYQVQFAVDTDQIKEKVPVNTFYDGTFANKMIETMGRYKKA